MTLKTGTLCVIVGGCPANIGIVVEVIAYLGAVGERDDAYCVRTVSGRRFAQVWEGSGSKRRLRNDRNYTECITDRHKLRPLVDPKIEEDTRSAKLVRSPKLELEVAK